MAQTERRKKECPLVTLAIPTYNRPAVLERALGCAIAQDYPGLEILVSDNATPGGISDAVVEKFKGKDPRITYFRQHTTLGSLGNFMFLLSQARGKYFMWLADDDAISSNYVSALSRILEADDSVSCAFCVYTHISPDGVVTKQKRSFASRSIYTRLAKYLFFGDDGFFYGLHRTRILRECVYERWWRPNQQVVTNWTYPYLIDVVIRGRVVLSDDESVEWLNDERMPKQYRVACRFYGIPQYLLLRLNLYCRYLKRAFKLRSGMFAVYTGLLALLALAKDYTVFGIMLSSSVVRRIRVRYRGAKEGYR